MVPDTTFAPVIRAGSQAIGPNGVVFETIEDLDMSEEVDSAGQNPLETQVARVSANGEPELFALRREVSTVAGRTVTETVSIGDFSSFLRLPLGNADVEEVLDVFDDQGNQWYEVDFLARYWDGEQDLVQVCADLDDPVTWEREMRALHSAGGEYPRARRILVTLQPGPVRKLPADVILKTAAEWLLEENGR